MSQAPVIDLTAGAENTAGVGNADEALPARFAIAPRFQRSRHSPILTSYSHSSQSKLIHFVRTEARFQGLLAAWAAADAEAEPGAVAGAGAGAAPAPGAEAEAQAATPSTVCTPHT